LELLEYGGGGQHSFVIVPEGREGSGWANCLSQMRRLEKYFEKMLGETKMRRSKDF
jgi:hypothetical protein